MTARTPLQIYAEPAFAAAPRLLSALDRDPLSRSFGSFDRDHWAWKFRDFPLTMLQLSTVPLATLWRSDMPGNPLHANGNVHAWILAALDHLCRRQRRNGAFDSVGPFTQDHGVTLAVSCILTETVRTLGDSVPGDLLQRITRSVDMACRFARRSHEDYAYISNHHALFALAYQGAAALLDDPDLERRGEAVIDAILARQSADGWYLEYDGPDPGYESLGIAYLARYWQRARSAELLDSLRRSTDFLAHCVHPDGSIGGPYGSRTTRLYFPSGFEILAPHLPAAAAIAAFMRTRLDHHNVVTLANVDAHNLAPLTASYLDAAAAAGPLTDAPQLPCERLRGVRCFDAATLCVAGTQHYYGLVSGRAGAVFCLWDRGTGRRVFEDAGYMIRGGGGRWVTQWGGGGRCETGAGGNEIACEAPLYELRQEEVTPGRFILLRLLNLTVFRSLRLGMLVRRLVIGRLITDRRAGPFHLRREVEFGESTVRIRDRLESTRTGPVAEVRRIRGSPGLHMGSARYHHESELMSQPEREVEGMERALGSEGEASCEVVVRFGGGTPTVEARTEGGADAHREGAFER